MLRARPERESLMGPEKRVGKERRGDRGKLKGRWRWYKGITSKILRKSIGLYYFCPGPLSDLIRVSKRWVINL